MEFTKDQIQNLQNDIDSIYWYHNIKFPHGLKIKDNNFHFFRVGKNKEPFVKYCNFFNVVEEIKTNILNHIDFKDKSVIDIGCIDGLWSFYAEEQGAKNVLAVDDLSSTRLTGEGLLLAKKILNSNIEINQNLNVYNLASLNKKFDVIIFFDVFHHLHSIFYGLSQIRHICHDNTKIIINGAITQDEENVIKYKFYNKKLNPNQKFTCVPTLQILCAFLEMSYFKIDKILNSNKAKPFIIATPFSGENDYYHFKPPFNLYKYDNRWKHVDEISKYSSIDISNLDLYDKYCNFNLYINTISTFGDLYEFGIYGGRSLQQIINDTKKYNKKYNKIFGFDSFEGLPEEHKDFDSIYFKPGEYNVQNLYNQNKENVKKEILKRTNNIPILIEGFFENVLTKELIEKYNMQPASFINIDCDLYISTYQVLDFIFSNKLWQQGTIIRYDDWFMNYLSGEEKAHFEIMKKYNIITEQVIRDKHVRLFRILGENT